MQVIPYNAQADPYSYLSQGFANLFGGLQGQYMQGLMGQDIQGFQQNPFGYQPQHPMAQQMALQGQLGNMFRDPLEMETLRARKAAEEARKAYWERPTAGTAPSPIMKMVNEGLLTLPEGKELARKEKEGNLNEKDIISIMHTIERALASTYTLLNEPLGGEKYAERRNYYAKQLDIYRKRLDQIRAAKTTPTPTPTPGRAGGKVSPKNISASYMRPKTKEQFIKTIEGMKAAGLMKEAKAYYDKWVNKIQW